MENNTTSAAGIVTTTTPATSGAGGGASGHIGYDSESRGSDSSGSVEEDRKSPKHEKKEDHVPSGKSKSRSASPDHASPQSGKTTEKKDKDTRDDEIPATISGKRRNKKGHRHHNNEVSDVDESDDDHSNCESEGANNHHKGLTRKELKAEKRAKKYERRHNAAATKKITHPEKRVGIYEVIHSVQLQGEADFMPTSVSLTPKPTPQAPPRMEDLMPLPDLELPPATFTAISSSNNDNKVFGSEGLLRSIVSSPSASNEVDESSKYNQTDSVSRKSPMWGVKHYPQSDSTSSNLPAPSPNNTTFAAKPEDNNLPSTAGGSVTVVANSSFGQQSDTPAGNLAALPPSALVAAVANSSVLPSSTGLAADSLLPLMVMEESRTTEVYEPADALERWLATHSDRTLARSHPTHTSQKGGMYHIPSIELGIFLEEWRSALLASDAGLAFKYGSNATGGSNTENVPSPGAGSTTPFFIEEVRTKQFRLYVDIDMVVCGSTEEDGLGIAGSPPPGSSGVVTNSPAASPTLGTSSNSAATSYLGVATAAAGVLSSPQSGMIPNTTTPTTGGVSPEGNPNGDSPTSATTTYKDLLRQICIETQQMFGVSDEDSAALVLYSHGPWPATPKEPTIIAKTGYRMYFQRIFVDQPTHRRYLTRLAEVIRRSLGAVPPTCPIGTTWSDIISDQCSAWDRTRLLGTVKLRRNLQRQYKFIGIFDSQHKSSNGRNAELSQHYMGDIKRLMFGQMIRVWDASIRLPKISNIEGGQQVNANNNDDEDELTAFSLGSPVEGQKPTRSRPAGFFGVRKGSGCRRRGTLKPLDSDEEAFYLQNQHSDDDSIKRSKSKQLESASFVTPVLKPIRPTDPTKDVVVDNNFRLDRYFTALEGLERASAATPPTSPTVGIK